MEILFRTCRPVYHLNGSVDYLVGIGVNINIDKGFSGRARRTVEQKDSPIIRISANAPQDSIIIHRASRASERRASKNVVWDWLAFASAFQETAIRSKRRRATALEQNPGSVLQTTISHRWARREYRKSFVSMACGEDVFTHLRIYNCSQQTHEQNTLTLQFLAFPSVNESFFQKADVVKRTSPCNFPLWPNAIFVSSPFFSCFFSFSAGKLSGNGKFPWLLPYRIGCGWKLFCQWSCFFFSRFLRT